MNISKGVFIAIALVWAILNTIHFYMESGNENEKFLKVFITIFLFLTWISLIFVVYNVSYEEGIAVAEKIGKKAYSGAKDAYEESTD